MKEKDESIKGSLDFKDAWDSHVINIENFISFVAYLEMRSKEEVLQEFIDDVRKEFH